MNVLKKTERGCLRPAFRLVAMFRGKGATTLCSHRIYKPMCGLLLGVVTVFAICGCRSTRSRVVQKADVLSQAQILAPKPDYPEERTGWNTNAVLVVFQNQKNEGCLVQFGSALRQALLRHGYRVVENLDNNDTDWLATEYRRKAKLIVLSAARSWGSAGFEGKNSSDYCLQVLVIDHPYDGLNLSTAVPHIRTFHVWSRATHADTATWNDADPLHAPVLAENLMRMPGFRAALELTPSPLAMSLSPKPAPAAAHTAPAATNAAPSDASSGFGDRASAENLVGTWTERVVAQVKTIEGGQTLDTSTSETHAKTVYSADGCFRRDVRMGNSPLKTFEGTWRIRNGRLYTETAAEATGRKWAVPCEYELVWNGKDAVVFRMTPDGYQGMLKSGGGDALGHCWYEPADVLHATITMGGFTVESESKIESAKRGNP